MFPSDREVISLIKLHLCICYYKIEIVILLNKMLLKFAILKCSFILFLKTAN